MCNYHKNNFSLYNKNNTYTLNSKINSNNAYDNDKFPLNMLNDQINNNRECTNKYYNLNQIRTCNANNENIFPYYPQNDNFDINIIFKDINLEIKKSDKPLNTNNRTVSISEALFKKVPPSHFSKLKYISKSYTNLELENIRSGLNQNIEKDFSGKNLFVNFDNIDNKNFNSIKDYDLIDIDKFDSYSNSNFKLNNFNIELRENKFHEINEDYSENVEIQNNEFINFLSSDNTKMKRNNSKIQNSLRDDMKLDINEINKFFNEGGNELIENINDKKFDINKKGSINYNENKITEEINKEMKYIRKMTADIRKNHLETLSTNEINLQ